MKKEYTQQDMEQILKGNAEIPLSVNRRIENTYRRLGLTGNTAKRTSAVRSGSVAVHRKRRRAWTAVAAAAALAAGLSLTAFAVVNFMNVQLNDNDGILSYDFQIDPSVSEAHEIAVTPTYLPDGYADTDDDRKWQDTDNPDNSITLLSYNAAEIYLSEQTGGALFQAFGKEEYVKTVEIQGMQTDLFLSGSDYTDSSETQKDLILCSKEQGYAVEIISIAEDQLSDDEMIKIAEGLDIRVLDKTVPFPTEEEIAQAKAAFESANSDDAYPDIKASDIYATGDTLRDQNAFSDGTGDSLSGNIEYRVTDIRILDSLPLEDYPKENYIDDYDTVVAPLLNTDGTLKPHDRYPADRMFRTENLETTGSKFVAVTTEITNRGSEKTEVTLCPSLVQLEANGDGTLSETLPYHSASMAYSEISRDGSPLYQSIQVHTENDKQHIFFADVEGGETLTCTSVYVVDDDCIDSSYLSFFRSIGALSEDGEMISQPYVKIQE